MPADGGGGAVAGAGVRYFFGSAANFSRHFTLHPGDLIFTGTPEGVISGYPKERQVWLKAGDRVTSTIEKLGELQFSLT